VSLLSISVFKLMRFRSRRRRRSQAITHVCDRVRVIADVLRIVGVTLTIGTVTYFYFFPIEARVRVDAIIQTVYVG
jgi:hypothetical protein